MRSRSYPRIVLLILGCLAALGVWCLVHYPPRPEAVEQPAGSNPDEEETDSGPQLSLVGKWRSEHGDGTVLEVESKTFRFSRDGKVRLRCGYDNHNSWITAWMLDSSGARVSSGWPSRPVDFGFEYEIRGKKLTISEAFDFIPVATQVMQLPDLPANGTLRFRRVEE